MAVCGAVVRSHGAQWAEANSWRSARQRRRRADLLTGADGLLRVGVAECVVYMAFLFFGGGEFSMGIETA